MIKSGGPRRPRILLADDDALMRTAIGRLLSPSCDVVGWIDDTETLFDAARALRPDVILLDLSLSGAFDVLDVCRRITSTTPDVNVIVFTARDDSAVRDAAVAAGASAFVWKLQASDELLRTIQAVVDDSPRPLIGDAS